jgi:hypothetical protein
LRDLLADNAHDATPRRLQFGQLGFNDVSLLAALEMLATLTNPFLSFKDEVGELIADFDGQEFQSSEPKDEVDFDIFVEFCLSDGALHEVGKKLAKGSVIGAFDGTEFRTGNVGTFSVLTDKVK